MHVIRLHNSFAHEPKRLTKFKAEFFPFAIWQIVLVFVLLCDRFATLFVIAVCRVFRFRNSFSTPQHSKCFNAWPLLVKTLTAFVSFKISCGFKTNNNSMSKLSPATFIRWHLSSNFSMSLMRNLIPFQRFVDETHFKFSLLFPSLPHRHFGNCADLDNYISFL